MHTIRRANLRLMTRERDHEPPLAVRAALPCREDIVKAANNALERWLAKAKVIA
ncbi:hypothetical protein [Roseateles chitinivorans]|uniref:hypothetical protein n=1 Tax=Roseateles chitinivorans TaxID=2917965 RepID=UPI0013042BAD|nr:hypothetical protein [Roseateles chitinivorans]